MALNVVLETAVVHATVGFASGVQPGEEAHVYVRLTGCVPDFGDPLPCSASDAAPSCREDGSLVVTALPVSEGVQSEADAQCTQRPLAS